MDYSSPVSSSAWDDVYVDVGDLLAAAGAVVYAHGGGFRSHCLSDGLGEPVEGGEEGCGVLGYRSSILVTWALGIMSVWPGALGWMSRKATTLSSSYTTWAGTLPADMAQKRQSSGFLVVRFVRAQFKIEYGWAITWVGRRR